MSVAEVLQIDRLDWNLFADQILEIERSSFSSSLRDTRETLRRLIQSPTSVALGLNDRTSGQLVGYIAGDLLELFSNIPGILSDRNYGRRDSLYIDSLAVNSQWRHQGYGTALTRNFLKAASKRGFRRSTAHIESNSLHKLKLRFRSLGSFDNWYGTGRTFEYVEFVLEDTE